MLLLGLINHREPLSNFWNGKWSKLHRSTSRFSENIRAIVTDFWQICMVYCRCMDHNSMCSWSWRNCESYSKLEVLDAFIPSHIQHLPSACGRLASLYFHKTEQISLRPTISHLIISGHINVDHRCFDTIYIGFRIPNGNDIEDEVQIEK